LGDEKKNAFLKIFQSRRAHPSLNKIHFQFILKQVEINDALQIFTQNSFLFKITDFGRHYQ
jgi:hypothetical protein